MTCKIYLKVVPDDAPNDDGEWISAELPLDVDVNCRVSEWPTTFAAFIPEGKHVVAVRSR